MKILSALRSYISSARQSVREQRTIERFPGVRFATGVLLRAEHRFFPGPGLFIDHRAYLNCAGGDWCDGNGYIRTGANCEIGPYCVIWGAGGVELGDDVHMGPHVVISSHEANPIESWVSDPYTKLRFNFEPVIIESHVLIASGAVLIPGVRIGHHSLIGAGAIVTSDIPPYSVAAGNPARVIRSIDSRMPDTNAARYDAVAT